jgi:hypothetical protein
MRQSAALRLHRISAPLLAALVAAGCFKYTPVETSAVPAQEDVRVRVTTDAAVRIGPHLGTITERLEGRLVPAGADSLTLAVWVGRDYVGSPFENARQRVSLGIGEVVEVRRRQLSVGRTSIAAAGVLLVTGILINRVVFEANPNPSQTGRPGPPPEPGGVRATLRVR